MKNGGISKAYLGSKFFDPSLIEPVKKKSLSCKFILKVDAPLNLQQNSSYIVPEEKTSNERVSRSQPRIARHGIDKKIEKDEFGDYFR